MFNLIYSNFNSIDLYYHFKFNYYIIFVSNLLLLDFFILFINLLYLHHSNFKVHIIVFFYSFHFNFNYYLNFIQYFIIFLFIIIDNLENIQDLDLFKEFLLMNFDSMIIC